MSLIRFIAQMAVYYEKNSLPVYFQFVFYYKYFWLCISCLSHA